MLKAMLIISALSGVGSDHKIPFETMEECLDARTVVEKQEAYIATLCIPYDPIVDERNRVEEFFSLFKEIINDYL